MQIDFQNQLKNLKRNRLLLVALILLFVCVIFWIGLSLVLSQKSSKISPKLKGYAQPLTPTFDTDILDGLDDKKHYSQQELESFEIYRLLTNPESGLSTIVPLEVTQADLDFKVEERERLEVEAAEAAKLNAAAVSAESTTTPVATPAPLTPAPSAF